MTYYNSNHEKLKLNDMKFLDCGECAKILYNKDIIFKEYFPETELCYRINDKMFNILKNINNPHFIELFDIYNDLDFVEFLVHKIRKSSFITSAYTAKYYSDNSVNVLFEHKDYILDNFRELDELFKIFSENMICADDTRRDNTIIGKDGIVIIDPDLFFLAESSKRNISTLNKKNLLHLFRDIVAVSLIREKNCEKNINFLDSELVNFEVTDNTDVAYEISKKLECIKRPIELFRK